MNLKSIPILYEDKDVLVVNKPAGLVVHSDGRTDEPTLVDWLLENYPEIKGVGEGQNQESRIRNQESPSVERSGIVHRLDRETSGVLVIAKNQSAFLFLKKQFQDREVEKTYHAFVYGEMKQDDGVIDRPIARSKSNPVIWSATRGMKGKEREAVTEYKVLARSNPSRSDSFGSVRQDGFSFVEVRPKTGRTHQIRVHMKAINHPVVCDKLYAPARVQRAGGPKKDCELGFSRLALHAFSVRFALPSGKQIKVEAPYPADFQKALKEWNYEF